MSQKKETEEELNTKLLELRKKQQECEENTKQISSLTTIIESIQEQNATQFRDQEQKNILERSKKKRILYLENFKVDDPLYAPFYTEYCKNSRIIPLFSEPFTVDKYNKDGNVKKTGIRSDIIVTRNINIFYNQYDNKFEVKYYRSDKLGNFKLNKDKYIKSINEIISDTGDNTYVFKFNNKTYGHNTNNVVEVSNKIKELLQYFTDNLETFKISISNFDNHIKYFIENNKSIKSKKFLSEVTFDIKYNGLVYNPHGSPDTKEDSLKDESLSNFFTVYKHKTITHFHNYDTLSETFPIPIEYYIKMRIAQTLFSDLPSNFKYDDDDKKKRLTDYDKEKEKVKKLIVNPKNTLIQDELIFTGKVNDSVKIETINAILISSYSNEDQLYIVDHALTVYKLVDSAEFVAPSAVAAVEPAAAPVKPVKGGKRSRRKRRKISKMKKIKTRKRLKRATIRYKKHRKKRTITRK